MRRASWAAALLASGLVVRLAWADVPVRLSYRAAPGCPEQAAFVELVRARGVQIRPVTEEGAPRYEVTVEQGSDGALGRLVLSGGGGEMLREVRAARCEEAAEALALVLALSLDPATAPVASSAAPVASSAAPPALPSAPLAPSALLAPPAPPTPAQAEWGAGVAGSLRSGVAPGLMGGGALSIERRTDHLLLRARVSFESSRTSRVDEVEPGTIQMRLVAAKLDACGGPLGLASSVALWPCAGLESGGLRGRGEQIAHPGSAWGWWMAARGSGLLRWSLSPRVALEAEGSLSLAMTRHKFVFEQPARIAARPDLLGGAASLGMVLIIP